MFAFFATAATICEVNHRSLNVGLVLLKAPACNVILNGKWLHTMGQDYTHEEAALRSWTTRPAGGIKCLILLEDQ